MHGGGTLLLKDALSLIFNFIWKKYKNKITFLELELLRIRLTKQPYRHDYSRRKPWRCFLSVSLMIFYRKYFFPPVSTFRFSIATFSCLFFVFSHLYIVLCSVKKYSTLRKSIILYQLFSHRLSWYIFIIHYNILFSSCEDQSTTTREYCLQFHSFTNIIKKFHETCNKILFYTPPRLFRKLEMIIYLRWIYIYIYIMS